MGCFAEITDSHGLGLQILTGEGLATRVKFDDRALLSELRAINQEAANRYLEHTVVKKRSAVSNTSGASLK